MRNRNASVLLAAAAAFVASLCGCGGTAGPQPQSPATLDPPVKNIIVVIMQNHSFDNLFGMFPAADGIRPGEAGYSQLDAQGAAVSPHVLTEPATPDLPHGRDEYLRVWNSGAMDKYAFYNGALSLGYYDTTTPGVDRLWAWASQYALADRFFTSVMSSAPSNQLFTVAASDNSLPDSIQPFYGPCNAGGKAEAPYTFGNVGDQLTGIGVTWAWYQENLWQCDNGYIPQQNPFQYFTSTHAAANLQDFSKFDSELASGTLPAVSFIQPAPDHSMHPGSGSIIDGLTWLDEFLQRVQASSIWPGVAVIVLWDESGGWWDHVPPPQVDQQGYGPRVPLLVVSPLAKRNYISHVQLDNTSILRFIQTNWGLPPLNSRNQSANTLNDLFAF